jgi:hypothetical protein
MAGRVRLGLRHRLATARRAALVALALVVGAATHVLWDESPTRAGSAPRTSPRCRRRGRAWRATAGRSTAAGSSVPSRWRCGRSGGGAARSRPRRRVAAAPAAGVGRRRGRGRARRRRGGPCARRPARRAFAAITTGGAAAGAVVLVVAVLCTAGPDGRGPPVRDASAGPEVLRAMEHPVVRDLLELHRRLEEVTWPSPSCPCGGTTPSRPGSTGRRERPRPPGRLPVLRGYGAALALRGAFDPDLPDPGEMEVLHQVLGGAVFEHGRRTEDLRADPRVGLGVDELRSRTRSSSRRGLHGGAGAGGAVLLRARGGEPGPAGSRRDDPDEAHRNLSRHRRGPDRSRCRPRSDAEEFLLQLDLRAIRGRRRSSTGWTRCSGGPPSPLTGCCRCSTRRRGLVHGPAPAGRGRRAAPRPRGRGARPAPAADRPDAYPVSPAVLRVCPPSGRVPQ